VDGSKRPSKEEKTLTGGSSSSRGVGGAWPEELAVEVLCAVGLAESWAPEAPAPSPATDSHRSSRIQAQSNSTL